MNRGLDLPRPMVKRKWSCRMQSCKTFNGRHTFERGKTMNDKAKYEAPTLTEVGSFEEITQAVTNGSRLDAPFDAGDLITDITTS